MMRTLSMSAAAAVVVMVVLLLLLLLLGVSSTACLGALCGSATLTNGKAVLS